MAMQNEILSGRFSGLLTRLFTITGGAPAPQLTPEVMPIVDLIEPATDMLVLEQVKLCTAATAADPVAAKFSAARLRNPAGSNALVTIRRIAAVSQSATTDVLRIGVQAVLTDYAQNPAAGSIAFRDTRILGQPAARFTFDNQSPPGTAPANLQYSSVAGNTVHTYTEPIVLSPGFAVDAYFNVINTIASYAFAWEERPMAPGETGPF